MARVGRTAAVVLAFAFGGVSACGSHASAPKTLTVTGAWARTTPPGATAGVSYLVVTSPTDDEIVGASVPPAVAAKVELHESMGGGAGAAMPNMPDMTSGSGEMTMVPLDRVALPAHKKVAFAPGGKHVMLTGLAAPLTAGSQFVLTLRFAHAPATDVSIEVRDNAP